MERFGHELLLLEKLAAGGMAEVYRAKQTGYGGFEKSVAVKRILPHYASNEEFKNMFRMEANLSGLLQHPNVVQIFGNGEFEGYLYLVMEFVDGKNLRQILARTDKAKVKIPIEIGCFIIAEAAKGLEYAHNFIDEKTGEPLEIVHRDMSPQNIMLSYDGGVKIVDFGIAKAAARADMTKAGVLKGKFGYMSPEQASGQKLDKRTDIFALGIICFEILTQRRLFTCDDDLRTLQLVRECRVPRPSRYNPAIPPGLDKIVMKALAKERGDRYATAGEFYADMLRFMNQSFPKFLPTDMSKFLKNIFSEDIVEERKKREKLAAEAPARLGSPTGRPADAADPNKSRVKTTREEDTNFDEEVKTQLSSATGSQVFEPHQPSMKEVAPEHAETRVTKDTPAEEPLPAPAESDFSTALGQSPGNLSLSLPVVGQLPGAVAPPSPRLTVDLQDIARPSFANADLTHTGIRPLPRPPRPRGNGKRVFLYGTCLAFLAAFIYLKQQPTMGMKNGIVARVSDGSMIVPDGKIPAKKSETTLSTVATLPGGVKPTNGAPAANQTPAEVAKNTAPAPANAAPATTPAENSPANTQRVPASEGSAPAANESPAPAPTENSEVTENVTPAKGGTGYLSVASAPRATEVFLNGEMLRDATGSPLQTPIVRQPVPSGKGHLKLRNAVFNVQWEGDIQVEADRILSLTPTLR